MKKILVSAALLIVAGAAAAFAAPPVIFFSDLTSGPTTGGKDNQGVFVTIVGKNFGATQGTGYVTVGGGRAVAYPVWTDGKITFQLGANASTGDIVVTTSEGGSNGLRFVVRSGRVFFVDDTSPNSPGSGTFADPWRSPRSFFTAQQPGDTCYFRAGTYSGQYGNASRPYNVSFYNTGAPSGSPDNEIAWVGYPGETALFKADSAAVYNGAFDLTSGVGYQIIAGLSIYGRGDGREQVRLYSANNKLVNCRIEGIKTLSYAMIGVTASNNKIWGNECFGATSNNKLDHIVYFQSSCDNVDIGWNYIHDNNINVGPVFSWNLGSGQTNNIRIHDNLIDCRNSSTILRLAGIWSGGGGSIYFYNNLVIEAGGSLNNDNAYNAIYVGFGTSYIYNNTFFRSRGAGSSYVVNVYNGASAVVKNNIFYNQSNSRYVNLASGNLTLDSNCYYGGAGGVPPGDPRPVAADPLFADAGAIDTHLRPSSPCIDKGADTTATAPRDYDGVARTAGRIDLGAWEYAVPGAVPVPPTNTNPATAAISGYLRDIRGNPIANAAVALAGGATTATATDVNGFYRFSDVPKNIACSITPSMAGFVFAPASIDVAALSGDLVEQNFTGRRKLSIKGRVKDKSGAALAAVRLELSGQVSGTTVSDGNGNYEFADVPEGFPYSVTSGKTGYHFEPALISTGSLSATAEGWDFSAVALDETLSEEKVKIIGSAAGRGTINPDKGETVKIYFKGGRAGNFECRIFTLTGDPVWEDRRENVQEGTFEWIPRFIASGIYVVRVNGPGVDVKRKIALLQ